MAILGLALLLPARPFERNLEGAPAESPHLFAVDSIRDARDAPPQLVHLLRGAFRTRTGSDIFITGWVVDPATPRHFADVLIAIDGRDATTPAVMGLARPDVARIMSVSNGQSGFEARASTRGFHPGRHTIQLVAVSDTGRRLILPVQVPLVLE